jgi:hypothetical protein
MKIKTWQCTFSVKLYTLSILIIKELGNFNVTNYTRKIRSDILKTKYYI